MSIPISRNGFIALETWARRLRSASFPDRLVDLRFENFERVFRSAAEGGVGQFFPGDFDDTEGVPFLQRTREFDADRLPDRRLHGQRNVAEAGWSCAGEDLAA